MKLRPGPSFIPCPSVTLRMGLEEWHARGRLEIPDHYIWAPATEGTIAGWRRPTETEWSSIS